MIDTAPLFDLPQPQPGDRVCFMGNTGEGKTVVACALLRSQPNVIVVNVKRRRTGPLSTVGVRVENDREIFDAGPGRYDFHPSDAWLYGPNAEALQNQFFQWALNNGNRVLYIDEFDEICKSAQSYPWALKKCVKLGREAGLGLWGSAQEPVRVPSFLFGQSQHRYVFFLGWDPHRKAAEAWFQEPIDWAAIPERSHRFFVKTPAGTFGPVPPLQRAFVA